MENRGASRRSTKKILNIHINSVLNKHERDSAITRRNERARQRDRTNKNITKKNSMSKKAFFP